MRALFGFAISMAAFVSSLTGTVLGQEDGPNPKPDQPPGNTAAKDTRLSLDEIKGLRGKHTSADKVVEMVAEQGRKFEITEDDGNALRKLGFNPAQLAAIRNASTDPLMPGQFLTTNDAQRDAAMELMRQVAEKSGAAIQSAQTEHVTLWAAKDVQKTILADIRKAEKAFHTKCAEPIRSGLDKRMTHVVLLNNRAEGTAWWHAMFELNPTVLDVKDNPGLSAQVRQQVLKDPEIHTAVFSVFCAGPMPEWTRRGIAFSVGLKYASQLIGKPSTGLQTGFGSWTEAAVFGSPAITGGEVVYQQEYQRGVLVQQDWGLLVKSLMSKNKTTPLAELLTPGQIAASQPLYAQRWSLVGLLNQQPAQFGRLFTAIKQGDSEFAAIERIYGWNEKELSRQMRVYGLSLGKRTAVAKRENNGS